MTAPLTITFFKPDLTHFVETMAHFLAEDPQIAVRIVTSPERGSGVAEHPWAFDRLHRQERIEMLDTTAPPTQSSLVVFGLLRHAPHDPALRGWLRQGAASAIFPETNRYASRLDWLRELARSFPSFLRARFLILERETSLLDLRFACSRRVLYTPSVHPQFLVDGRLREAMCSPAPGGPRRFRLTFLGSRQPPERAQRLESCQRELKVAGAAAITTRYPGERASGTEALWIEYDATTGTTGLDPLAYTAALGETDFCLSPPGWGRNWAHRTVEAMIRGAIPVIEDPELYNLPLVDGVNCVIVQRTDWAFAVRRCLDFPADRVDAIRAGVLRLREERLLPEVAARDFRRAFIEAAVNPVA